MFAPLCVQGPIGETQIVYQVVQNVEMVTDVARALGVEEIQTAGEVRWNCLKVLGEILAVQICMHLLNQSHSFVIFQ